MPSTDLDEYDYPLYNLEEGCDPDENYLDWLNDDELDHFARVDGDRYVAELNRRGAS